MHQVFEISQFLLVKIHYKIDVFRYVNADLVQIFEIVFSPLGGFSYQYSLQIDGKPYKTFLDNQTKVMKTW